MTRTSCVRPRSTGLSPRGLSRATMQEELTITVAPDPDLTVYDVIEIEGGPEPLQGRWLIQALSGVTPAMPFTQIQARRSRSSVGVTHG